MGASLAWGVRAAPVAAGWVIALADMPWVRAGDDRCCRRRAASRRAMAVAAPNGAGTRGHPVGFAAALYAELDRAVGRRGREARYLRAIRVTLIATEDPGVLRDVDTPADLER